ncbi:DICT sensory domain-containing protein [Salarchaeum japonicum]|uniref:DICT sensory domain-containing protein n=1 Tax=Salarchaeum japonicum TaxID=555573 RepID=A0AAV3T3J3_9EURY|nr:DICT sensory domain-containing protein [Salarchaeum japonicum]
MGLRDIVSGVESREKTLTVYTPTDALADAVRDYFASQNVRVAHEPVADAADARVELSDGDGERVTSVDVEAVDELVSGRSNREFGDAVPYRALLEHLDRATFTSYDRRQMVTASREVEDRAWRVGEGLLVAGFQTLSTFETQHEAYRLLAETNLDVHVYGAPDADVASVGTTLHPVDSPDVRETWFVAFDGGPSPEQKSALLAEEREPGEFYGFWTYDPDTVDRIIDAVPGTANRPTA